MKYTGREARDIWGLLSKKSFATSSGGAVSGHLSASYGSQSKALQIYADGKQEKIHTRKKGNRERRQNEKAHFFEEFVSQFIAVEYLEILPCKPQMCHKRNRNICFYWSKDLESVAAGKSTKRKNKTKNKNVLGLANPSRLLADIVPSEGKQNM